MAAFAVLLMAHGTPSTENDVEAYLTNIRGGRKPSREDTEDLKERYQRIGGRSPLLDITMSQASALEETLASKGLEARVYAAMKHWHPYIEEAVPQILADGFRKVIALVLAPHYSHLSIGEYKQVLHKAREASRNRLEIKFIESWHDHPLFHLAVAEKIRNAINQSPTWTKEKVQVVFTAHSLPERILRQNDPYPKQLLASCRDVASLLKIDRWSFAYQSARQTGEKWLGPDILEVLEELSLRRNAFGRNVLIVPIGFVADHLETLYDLDVEAQLFAKAHRLTMKRAESLNTSPLLISALAEIVRKRLN